MQPIEDHLANLTRRSFIGRGAHGIGSLALGSLFLQSMFARGSHAASPLGGGIAGLPHFAPKAKRVLCLFQSEGFSHIDLFDQKQALWDHAGKDLPASVKGTQRVTGICITASHNAEEDNGIKISDPDGGMLHISWEQHCNDLANAPDDGVVAAVQVSKMDPLHQ